MILIIGYGNPLRSDDAIGQCVAQMMEQRLEDEYIQIETVYQLTPELVEPIHRARQVFFIDARLGELPGKVLCEMIQPEVDSNAFTHHVTPSTLLGAARELYEATPTGIMISIVGASFDYGGELSPELSRMLPILTDQTEAIVRAYSEVAIQEKIHHA